MYYTKYKSFWATLNTNQTEKQKKFLNFLIHQNEPLWPLSLFHRFSIFFPPKTESRHEDCFAPLSSKICQRWAAHVACLAQTFRSSSSYNSSMGFKSSDCASQDINWTIWCSSLLLMYSRQSLQVNFEVIILYEYKSLSHKSHSRWGCVMLQYTVRAGLIHFCPSPGANLWIYNSQKPSTP